MHVETRRDGASFETTCRCDDFIAAFAVSGARQPFALVISCRRRSPRGLDLVSIRSHLLASLLRDTSRRLIAPRGSLQRQQFIFAAVSFFSAHIAAHLDISVLSFNADADAGGRARMTACRSLRVHLPATRETCRLLLPSCKCVFQAPHVSRCVRTQMRRRLFKMIYRRRGERHALSFLHNAIYNAARIYSLTRFEFR